MSQTKIVVRNEDRSDHETKDTKKPAMVGEEEAKDGEMEEEFSSTSTSSEEEEEGGGRREDDDDNDEDAESKNKSGELREEKGTPWSQRRKRRSDGGGRRRKRNGPFRHGNNGRGEETDKDKHKVIRMAQISGVSGCFNFFWGLMLLANVGVNMHDKMVLERTCAGPPLVGILFINVAWSFFFVCFVAYKRMAWNAYGWDEEENMFFFATLALLDLAMSLWFLGACACAANEAIFFIFVFLTVLSKVVLAVQRLYEFNLPTRLIYGVYLCEGLMRRDLHGNSSQYKRTPNKEGVDEEGYVQREYPVVSPSKMEEGSAVARKLSFARSDVVPQTRSPLRPFAGRRKIELFKRPGSAQSRRDKENISIDPSEFSEQWENTSLAGEFEIEIETVPKLSVILKHLEEHNFTPVAHGVVRDCTKVYFHASDVFEGRSVVFLCELKIWHSSKLLSATFKCKIRDYAKEFVKRLNLGKIFQ